jgi:sugar lactone lactonase YvrE
MEQQDPCSPVASVNDGGRATVPFKNEPTHQRELISEVVVVRHQLREPPMPLSTFPRITVVAFFMSAAGIPIIPANAQMLDKLKSETSKLVAPITGSTDKRLEEVAKFDHQVTGVTVTEDGRIFVNFPRWSEDVPVSVAEVQKDGSIKPYPNDEWNSWRNVRMNEVTPGDHFVTVQSVVADGRGSLWVVDAAAPNSEKVIKGGPKLLQIDLKTNAVKRTYAFGTDVAGPASYLNDVRISPDGKFGYMTDSGSPGALVIVDLASGKAWRALSDDASTQADPTVVVTTDGKPLKRPDGRGPMFNADGIALSPDGRLLYFQALTGKTLYRIDTAVLQNPSATPEQITAKLEKIATTEPSDGFWMDKSGRLFLSTMQSDSIKMLTPDNKLETVLTDSRLRWPDTFSQGPDVEIYITASHIQDSPWFHTGGWTDDSFTLFKFQPPAK